MTAAFGAASARCRARLADRPSCALSSGSWSTRSAARAPRDGPTTDDGARRPRGTRSSRPASPGRTCSSRRGPRSRRSTAGPPIGSARPRRGRRGRRPDPRPSSAPAAVGLRLRPARSGRRDLGRRRRSRPSPRPSATTCAPLAGGSRTCASIPRSNGMARGTRTVPSAAALRGAGWRPRARSSRRAPESSTCDRTRPTSGRRPAQEVAPVRQQGALRRDHGRRRRGRPPARVLPDLPRDRGPGRVPHPRPRRAYRDVGRRTGRRAGPPAVRPTAGRRGRWRRCSSCAAVRGSWSRTAA